MYYEHEPFLPQSTVGPSSVKMNKIILLGGGGLLALFLGCVIGGLIGHFGFPNPPVSPYADLLNEPNPDVTKRIVDLVDGDQIATFLRYLTGVPHVAGTEFDLSQAEWVRDKFLEFGLDEAEIVPYKVLLSYPPIDTPNKVQLTYTNGSTMDFTSRQPPLFAQEEGDPRINSNFAAYSAAGLKTGNVVYAYYGRAEDYAELEKLNIDPAGKIVLARYGQIFRGNIVLEAQKRGAIGVLLFSDPKDFSPRGRDQVYPNTVDLPGYGVQSGTIMLSDGDPLTPNYPSIESANFDWNSKMYTELPQIPTQPIGYNDAEILLNALAGPPPPAAWKGDLSSAYNLGGSFVTDFKEVKMDIRTTIEQRMTYNVIGTLHGAVEKDRYVLLGNHRDAWSLGAIDPSSGTSSLLEIARVYGKLATDGWRPRRSLKFCSWGAEEYGLVGSIEWIEQNRKLLEKQAVAYINVDIAVEGNYSLYGKAVPLLYNVLVDSTKLIPNPNPAEVSAGRKTMYDTWMKAYPDGDRPKISGLGSGSDYKGFIHNLGIPCIDFRYTYEEDIGSYPLYHTMYETYHLLAYLYDDGMAYMKSVTQLWGETARVLADSLIVPLDASDYATYIKKTFGGLNDSYNSTLAIQNITLVPFEKAVSRYETQASKFMERVLKVDKSNPFDIRAINDKLMMVERMFIDPLGISDRADVVNHVLFAPSSSDNYSSVGFAGLTDLIEAAKVSGSVSDWDKVKQHLSVIVFLVGEAANVFTSV